MGSTTAAHRVLRPATATRLLGDSIHSAAQSTAIESLGRIGAPAVPRLVELLRNNSGSTDARYGAGCALGRIGGSDVVEPLCEALSDAESHVRRGAATGLHSLPRQYSSGRVISALTRALQDHDDRIDWLSAMAFGELGDISAIPALAALAQGPQPVPSELLDDDDFVHAFSLE